ncbi:DCN1-like protein 3 [Halocaridina rubra]|uniref:Defective in cullin neddylation protein n=1 Tax=Halocaridina rubra TaxID=373956 RepID=A0AAN9A755_HALRR
MGKCLSCLKVSPPAHHHQSIPQYPPLQHALPRTTEYERTRSTDTEVSESDSSASGVEGYTPVQPPDAQSNGSGKNSVIVNASEKRSFYSRIPPLVKSASNEVRRLSSKDYSETKIIVLFDQYRDVHSDVILSEGIERFCRDLDVRPEEFKVLVLAWKFGAETMCKFSKREFVNGCKSLRVDSIKGIQSKFSDMLLEVQEPEKFKDLYRFTFKFGLDVDTGQRILPADMAMLLWKLVFSQQEPAILKRWLTFLELHPNVRGIPRDTWNMFLNFTEAVGDDLSTYDDTEAWPSLFDDFVEYENDQLNQNVKKDLREESD